MCAGGAVSPWSSQYPDLVWDYYSSNSKSKRFIERGSVFERSTWRFAAGFEGDEEFLTWHRDPQYRRCARDCHLISALCHFALCDDDVCAFVQ